MLKEPNLKTTKEPDLKTTKEPNLEATKDPATSVNFNITQNASKPEPTKEKKEERDVLVDVASDVKLVDNVVFSKITLIIRDLTQPGKDISIVINLKEVIDVDLKERTDQTTSTGRSTFGIFEYYNNSR